MFPLLLFMPSEVNSQDRTHNVLYLQIYKKGVRQPKDELTIIYE